MSYTINLSTGVVTRDLDGKQVAPGQSVEDPDYVGYITWVANGNRPTEVSIPLAGSRRITKFAFRSRFTTAEKLAVELASIDDPNGSLEQRQLAAMIRVFSADVNSADSIDLDMADTQSGVLTLAQFGLILPERADAVINGPIAPHEYAIE